MTPLRSKLILVQVRTGGFGARVQTLQPARLAGDQAAGPGGGGSTRVQAWTSASGGGRRRFLFTPELSSHVPGLSESTLFPLLLFRSLFKTQNLLFRRSRPCSVVLRSKLTD